MIRPSFLKLRFWRAVAVVAGLALIAAGCGGDDDSESSTGADTGSTTQTADTAPESTDDDTGAAEEPSTTPADSTDDPDPVDDPGEETGEETGGSETTEDPPEEPMNLTASWRGVTAESITIGVSMLDFGRLKEMGLAPSGWGDQQAVFQALVDNLNANGGINGRAVVPVYDFYNPIDTNDATRACTALTQDNEVFAVVLGFVGPAAGTADPCFVGTNETILVGGEHTSAELEQAKAPWFNVEPSTNDQTTVLLDLLVETGRADGASVFVVTHQASADDAPGVLDALADRGFDVAGDAILDANDGDTAAQDSFMQVISERIRSEGTTAVLINGNPAATIRGLAQNGLMGEIDVWSNDAPGLNNLGATFDHADARGVVTSDGPSERQIYDDPRFQAECLDVVGAADIGADLRPAEEIQQGEENWFSAIRRYCMHLSLFVEIATAAGADLTPETFEAAAHSLSDFSLPGLPAASLSPTKFGARDVFQLAAFDPDAGEGGQVEPLGELVDIYP